MTDSEATAPGGTSEPDRTGVADACARLQADLDELLGEEDGQKAVASLDNAVASLKEVEQRNVSSVQLVALTGG